MADHPQNTRPVGKPDGPSPCEGAEGTVISQRFDPSEGPVSLKNDGTPNNGTPSAGDSLGVGAAGGVVPGGPALAEQVARVPTDPGCYLWKDASGKVVYVGKAKNLRARMRQYVTLQDDRAKIPLMMEVIRGFDYVVVGSEHEALVLERNLIAQYHPYFNVDLKDDKSYPYIAITESDVFPAIKYTRERHRAGTRYFGPYTRCKPYAGREVPALL